MGFTDNMKAAKENANDFITLPLGTYTCVLVKAWRHNSKAGNQQVGMDWRIIEATDEVEVNTKDRQFHRLEGNRVDVAINIMKEQFKIMEMDIDSIEEEEEFDQACEALTERHPIVKYTVFKKGTYTNKKVAEFLEDYQGFKEEGSEAEQTSSVPTSTPAESKSSESSEIEVGKKYKYKHNDVEKVGVIKSLNHETGTIDFAFDKGIEVDSIIEAVA